LNIENVLPVKRDGYHKKQQNIESIGLIHSYLNIPRKSTGALFDLVMKYIQDSVQNIYSILYANRENDTVLIVSSTLLSLMRKRKKDNIHEQL